MQIDAVEQHPAAVEIVEPRTAVEECRLAGTRRSHHGNELAFAHDEIHIAERGDLLRAGSIHLADALGHQELIGHRISIGSGIEEANRSARRLTLPASGLSHAAPAERIRQLLGATGAQRRDALSGMSSHAPASATAALGRPDPLVAPQHEPASVLGLDRHRLGHRALVDVDHHAVFGRIPRPRYVGANTGTPATSPTCSASGPGQKSS